MLKGIALLKSKALGPIRLRNIIGFNNHTSRPVIALVNNAFLAFSLFSTNTATAPPINPLNGKEKAWQASQGIR